MIERECPRCFGSKEEFNGEIMVTCSRCHGDGSIMQDDDQDDYIIDLDDLDENIQFDENLHSPYPDDEDT